MQFEYTAPQTPLEQFVGGFFCVNAFGSVEPGDADKFQRFIKGAKVQPRTHVYIDSGGGHVETAIEIGRTIRSGWLSTEVGKYLLDPDPSFPFMVPRKRTAGACISAATLMFLGGRLRYLSDDAQFGVHQFSFKNPSPDDLAKSQVLSAKIASYVAEMGISTEFLELSSSVIGTKIEILEKTRLEAMRVVTGGQTEAQWTIKAANGSLYVRGERDSIFGHHKVILGFQKEMGFYFIAVIESQNRDRELTSFSVVEIVLNGEAERIDISKRCERKVSGIYVNVASVLTNEEARKISLCESFGVQIRFSKEADVFLGISAVSTKGGEDLLNALYASLK